MTAKNDITGDLIKSKPSDTYSANYDAIFRKDKTIPDGDGIDDVGGGEKSESIG